MVLNKNQIYVIDNFIPLKEQHIFLQNTLTSPGNISYSTHQYNGCQLQINDPRYNKLLPENQFIIGLGQEKTIFLF